MYKNELYYINKDKKKVDRSTTLDEIGASAPFIALIILMLSGIFNLFRIKR